MSNADLPAAVVTAHALTTRAYYYHNGASFPLTRGRLVRELRFAKHAARRAARRTIWADQNPNIPTMIRDIYREGAYAHAERVADLYAGLSTR